MFVKSITEWKAWVCSRYTETETGLLFDQQVGVCVVTNTERNKAQRYKHYQML